MITSLTVPSTLDNLRSEDYPSLGERSYRGLDQGVWICFPLSETETHKGLLTCIEQERHGNYGEGGALQKDLEEQREIRLELHLQ